MIATEAGRGRKQCPGCERYVGVRTFVCASCGHTFTKGDGEAKQPTVRVIPTSAEGGRGRKQCPQCQNYVGVRTSVCPCGHQFGGTKPVAVEIKASPKKPEAEPEPQPRRAATFDPRMRRIAYPEGKCPVSLSSTDPDEVELWAHAVIGRGHERGVDYLVSALRYWVRQFFDIHGPEHRSVCETLNGIFVG